MEDTGGLGYKCVFVKIYFHYIIEFSGKRIKLKMKNDRQDASAYYLDAGG